VVCAAPDGETLRRLKMAAAGATWELSSGATSATGAMQQLEDHHAVALVVHEPVPGLVRGARKRFPGVRIVVVGTTSEGADVVVASTEEIRAAILGPDGAARP
jgi:hypothetical protein